jgi:hypothetical protein
VLTRIFVSGFFVRSVQPSFSCSSLERSVTIRCKSYRSNTLSKRSITSAYGGYHEPVITRSSATPCITT